MYVDPGADGELILTNKAKEQLASRLRRGFVLGLIYMGAQASPSSSASTTTPRQSAEALPDTGGGDGQDRNGLLPLAAAVTRTLMS